MAIPHNHHVSGSASGPHNLFQISNFITNKDIKQMKLWIIYTQYTIATKSNMKSTYAVLDA